MKSAEVDPDHKVWLDRDRYNNSMTTEPQHNRTGAYKLANFWALLNEGVAQILMWLF